MTTSSHGLSLLASALTDEGTTTVTASCTDAVGSTMQTTFRVNVSLFPLSPEGLNPSIYKVGSFSTSTHGLTTGEDGFGGWQYVRPADLSQHRYLVVNLRRAAANSPAFRLPDIQRGVNILRYPNGVVKKVFVK